MSTHFAKPENALRKAKDLVRVSKPHAALKTLHSILLSKRFRQWTVTHEKIIQFYIDLAVEHRRSVKDALIQYRSICQQTNSASLDKVLRYYKQVATDKLNAVEVAAKAEGQPIVPIDSASSVGAIATIDEDEGEDSNESLLIALMSGETVKERSDRALVQPWLKYEWECHRTILDVLRNNAKLERMYHDIARSAFAFCLQYQRKLEFRKLCEIIRTHLFNTQKYQNQNNSVDLKQFRNPNIIFRNTF